MKQYPEVLKDTAAYLTQLLEGEGLPADRASEIAYNLTEQLRKRWSGRQIYIPKAEHLELSARDLEIYGRWRDGESYEALARIHDMTVSHVRWIINAMRRARRQPAEDRPLFEAAG